jgi:uncharacterized membrane protein
VRSRPAPDPAAHPQATFDPVERSRAARAILWLKVIAAGIEIAAGIALLFLGIFDVNIGGWVRHLASRELQADPGDFIARHVIANIHAITRVHEVLDGAVLALYGALKGGVVGAVLLHHHRIARFGAVLFTVVALAAAVVLLGRPTAFRAALGALDLAVAVVMIREAMALGREPTR